MSIGDGEGPTPGVLSMFFLLVLYAYLPYVTLGYLGAE